MKAIGEGYVPETDMNTLSAPPDGMDSVICKVGKTQNLNYDEVVVYKDDAALPQYIILYQ